MNLQQKSVKLQLINNKSTISLQISEQQEANFQSVCSLQDLAMKELVTFITTTIQRLKCFKSEKVPALFEELQILLHQSIPIPVWEALVPRLIDALQLLFVDISEMREILLLTLHPLGTTLHSYWQLEAMKILDTANKQERFTKIQVLKISTEVHDLLQEALPQLCFLEYFELQYHSNDEIIAALSLHCGKLKYLNVYGSEEVTNESVSAILSLTSLKSLKIAKTSINVMGLDLLFSKTIQQRQENNVDILDLQYLEFSNGIRKNYEKLVNAFPHLKHLGIYYIRSGLEMLSSLQELTSFLYYDGHFQHFTCILPVLGKQFHNLHLECVQELDLNLIAKYCAVLRSLTLKSITSIINLPKHFLPTVRSVTIDSAQIAPEVMQLFVAQCNNLEKLIFNKC